MVHIYPSIITPLSVPYVCLSVCQSDPLNCLPFYQKIFPTPSSPDASFPLYFPSAVSLSRSDSFHRRRGHRIPAPPQAPLIRFHTHTLILSSPESGPIPRDQLEWFRRIPPSVQHRSLCRSSNPISCVITGGRSIGSIAQSPMSYLLT